MYLALLGFGMIVVFMALIMAKKLSPFTSLILIPILFGLLAGYGWDTLSYARVLCVAEKEATHNE